MTRWQINPPNNEVKVSAEERTTTAIQLQSKVLRSRQNNMTKLSGYVK